MYLIKMIGQEIPIDADELGKLEREGHKPLIFFRRGAVNPKHIVSVVEDTNRRQSVMKLPGETKEDVQKRIEAERGDDIFSQLRNPALSAPVIKTLHDGKG